jgi:hypothetical protein
MKYKIIYLLPFLLAFTIGCSPDKTPPTPSPSGVFTGQFERLHLHSGVVDTVKANIQLTMELATGYTVTGDTTVVHAGSYGSYAIESGNYLQFVDRTYSGVGVPAKVHLSGTYQYLYDGTTFQIFAGNDTVSFQYSLKKIAN